MQTEKTFLVAEANIKRVEEEVARLNRKARKLGCPPLHLTIGADPVHTKIELHHFRINQQMWVVDQSKDHNTALKGGWKPTGRVSPTYEVVLTGEAPAYDGWEFVATLEPNPARTKNLIFAVPGREVPKKFRTTAGKCDHCGINRYRRKTYVVMKENEYKQVGSTCIKDFLGHNDPKSLMKRMEYLTDMVNSLSDKALPGTRTDAGINLSQFVAHVAREMREYGWVSRSKAMGSRYVATADSVLLLFSQVNALYGENSPSEGDYERADSAINWAKNLPEDVSDGYLYNLHTVAKSGVVTYDTAGIAASIIVAHSRAIRKAKEIKNLPKSEWVGTPGERSVFTITVEKIHSVETIYGIMDIIIFSDEDGNTLVWKTSSAHDFDAAFDTDETITYRVRATVKEHAIYRNRKQTTISRVNILDKEEV